MSTNQSNQAAGADTSRRVQESESDPFAEMVSLARSSTSPYGYLVKAFRTIARSFSSPYAALHARFASEEVRDDVHFGPGDPAFWKASLESFLVDSLAFSTPRAKLLSAKKSALRVGFLSAPLFDPGGKMIGAIALVAANITERNVHQHLSRLTALARLASFSCEFLGGGRAEGEQAGSGAPNKALVRAATATTTEELAFSITNTLRNKTGCEQVALGMVVRNRVRLISISGLDDIKHQSPGVRCLQGAMEECLDRKLPIVCQQEQEWAEQSIRSEHRLHKQWQTIAEGDAVASIPLQAHGATAAILSLRRRPDQPFTREQLGEIHALVEPFAGALLLTRKAHRSLLRHTLDTAHSAVDVFRESGRTGAKVGLGVAAALAVWFFFGTLDYQITVPCTVTPTHVRHLAAPFEGVLASAEVVAGDRVRQGQVLCRFDAEQLELQKAELLAEIAVLERERDLGMANNDPASVQVAMATQHQSKVKLEIVEHRIRQATIRAPLDGIVVSGDLRTRIGGVLPMGEELFAVSPLGEWTLELEIPDSASADIRVGQGGAFASYARPEQVQELRLTRIRPQAEVRNENNVYIAEAEVHEAHDWIRPGMEGVAKVHLGPRRVWWVTLHRVIDYLRLKLWL
jgi:hypothetical protein